MVHLACNFGCHCSQAWPKLRYAKFYMC